MFFPTMKKQEYKCLGTLSLLVGIDLQTGEEDLSRITFFEIAEKYLIILEKCDGANSVVFINDGTLMLQSRGHYLTGGISGTAF